MQVSSEEGLLASCNWAENSDSLQWILQWAVNTSKHERQHGS